MTSNYKGLLKVRCAWVHDNAFYWAAELYNVKRHRKLFRTTIEEEKIASYKYGDISHVFSEAEKLSWKFKVFTVVLDKTNL